ncbi:MAG TPA: Plug domain-containing protein, partial [Gemmatimonadaceae bacterium]
MIRGIRRLVWQSGLGVAAGAVLCGTALAQVTPRDTVRPRPRPDTVAIPIPPRPDTTAADTTTRPDTAAARDTVLPPLARAPRPEPLAIGGDYRWDRDALFASGAMTLTDLLERVPGVTSFRTGWLLTPEHVTYVGEFQRVRIFYDGVELDALDPRGGGLQELSRIPLYTLEEVAVERAAGELRIHLRSWRVTHTTPSTRFDVATGEFNTNLFRGFFGRRFRNGAAVQAGFQQFSTEDRQFGGDGDQLAIFTRVGWADGPWSVDATARRTSRFQTLRERRFADRGGLPELESTRTFAYLRGGYRDAADEGVWAQVIASTQSLEERTAFRPALGPAPSDSADTTRS